MTTTHSTVSDIEGARSLRIEANHRLLPDSVFLIGPNGFVMEFDRESLVRAMKIAIPYECCCGTDHDVERLLESSVLP